MSGDISDAALDELKGELREDIAEELGVAEDQVKITSRALQDECTKTQGRTVASPPQSTRDTARPVAFPPQGRFDRQSFGRHATVVTWVTN